MTSQRQSSLDGLLCENHMGPFRVFSLCRVAPCWTLPGGGAKEALRGGGGFLPLSSVPLSDLRRL